MLSLAAGAEPRAKALHPSSFFAGTKLLIVEDNGTLQQDISTMRAGMLVKKVKENAGLADVLKVSEVTGGRTLTAQRREHKLFRVTHLVLSRNLHRKVTDIIRGLRLPISCSLSPKQEEGKESEVFAAAVAAALPFQVVTPEWVSACLLKRQQVDTKPYHLFITSEGTKGEKKREGGKEGAPEAASSSSSSAGSNKKARTATTTPSDSIEARLAPFPDLDLAAREALIAYGGPVLLTPPYRSSFPKYACQRPAPRMHPNRHLSSFMEALEEMYLFAVGDNERATAFGRALAVLRSWPWKITSSKELMGVRYIGESMRGMIDEILDTGRCSRLGTSSPSVLPSFIQTSLPSVASSFNTCCSLLLPPSFFRHSIIQPRAFPSLPSSFPPEGVQAHPFNQVLLSLTYLHQVAQPLSIHDDTVLIAFPPSSSSPPRKTLHPEQFQADPTNLALLDLTRVHQVGLVTARKWVNAGYTSVKQIQADMREGEGGGGREGGLESDEGGEGGGETREEGKEEVVVQKVLHSPFYKSQRPTRAQVISLLYVEEYGVKMTREIVAGVEGVVRQAALRALVRRGLRPETLLLTTCGGYRRGKELNGDVDVLVSCTRVDGQEGLREEIKRVMVEEMGRDILVLNEGNVTAGFAPGPAHEKIASHDSMLMLIKYKGLYRRLDVISPPPDQWAFCVLGWSGSKQMEKDLRDYASERGFHLSQQAVYKDMKRQRNPKSEDGVFHTEKEVWDYLGLQFLPPCLRWA